MFNGLYLYVEFHKCFIDIFMKLYKTNVHSIKNSNNGKPLGILQSLKKKLVNDKCICIHVHFYVHLNWKKRWFSYKTVSAYDELVYKCKIFKKNTI